MSWRDEQRPPSFRGVPFKVQTNTRIGGRRGFTYEFAKSERSVDEDLGRRVARASVSAYVIGLDCLEQADELEAALLKEGGGLLVLPTMGRAILRCEVYQRTETKDEGGIVRFEMTFVRSQSGATSQAQAEDTQAASGASAAQLADATDLSAGTDDDWS
ncbi:DNA circularization N-terminal domain-containing protein [Methylobacterium sp. J-070]|uniref:DNA circularization N-terminal domain-containing protein n=1 Tax=Methylobacterium sp. J-070 TaxID=2836650 RepID=UPI001FBB89F8|nr:DNA circularization N-terminal domain-containing protein [Methylobacterium sp. J-070]MCJ2053993.1 DNA circularization N-terminal domain-containing protein [Methylobacterium sp. J-070]